MNYKEIKSLKKSELQELLATTLQQKATQDRVIASLQYTEENILIDELYSGIDERDLEIDALSDKTIDLIDDLQEAENLLIESRDEANELRDENIKLHKRLECLLDNIDRLETENKIHMREKKEARVERDKAEVEVVSLRESLIKLDNLLAEGSTPKNIYIHEIETIFADSGELHLHADNDKSVVFNCYNLVQDLATINDMVIKSAKRDLKDSIQQIKQLTKDI